MPAWIILPHAHAAPHAGREAQHGGAAWRLPTLRGFALLVPDFFELGVDHVFLASAGGAPAPRPAGRIGACPGGTHTRTGGPGSGAGLRVGALRDRRGSLRERIGLLGDHVLVVALQGRAQVGERRLDARALLARDLVAEVLERLLDGVNEAVRLVARLDELAKPPVFLRVRLGIAHHALDFLLGEAARGLDDDLLLLAGRLVPRGDIEDPIRVDVEGDLDLRHAARRGRNVREVELA